MGNGSEGPALCITKERSLCKETDEAPGPTKRAQVTNRAEDKHFSTDRWDVEEVYMSAMGYPVPSHWGVHLRGFVSNCARKPSDAPAACLSIVGHQSNDEARPG